MQSENEHSKAKLSKSELVTIGLLFALKGASQHAFYRWLQQNFAHLFRGLPERTRLFRRLKTHRRLTMRFLADATVLGVADSFGIELCHPIRERRAPRKARIGKKGLSNWRMKVCARGAAEPANARRNRVLAAGATVQFEAIAAASL